MRIAFDPEQHDLAAAFDRAVAPAVDPGLLRRLWDDPTGRSEDLWRAVVELGLPAIVVPEKYGGLGGSILDLALVLSRAGYHAVPDALLEALVTGPIAIARAGTAEQKERWLPLIASGEARVTAALRGSSSVPDAHVSDVVVRAEGGRLSLARTADCRLTPLTSMDPSRRQFAVAATDDVWQAMPGDAIGDVRAHESAGSAQVLIGLSQRLLDDTVAYVKVRQQFGRTIGSFQAVKHQLADATAALTLARFQAHAAIAKVAHGADDAGWSAGAAQLVALDAEFEANRVALQLHGGIGFTWEHDLQLWLKRGKALEQAHGNRRELADEIGAAVLARR